MNNTSKLFQRVIHNTHYNKRSDRLRKLDYFQINAFINAYGIDNVFPYEDLDDDEINEYGVIESDIDTVKNDLGLHKVIENITNKRDIWYRALEESIDDEIKEFIKSVYLLKLNYFQINAFINVYGIDIVFPYKNLDDEDYIKEIEAALGIKLNQNQIDYILDETASRFNLTWDRQTGRTTAYCIVLILSLNHSHKDIIKSPITYADFWDANSKIVTNLHERNQYSITFLTMYLDIWKKLRDHGFVLKE